MNINARNYTAKTKPTDNGSVMKFELGPNRQNSFDIKYIEDKGFQITMILEEEGVQKSFWFDIDQSSYGHSQLTNYAGELFPES